MAYVYYNANPKHRQIEDCTIRAICKLQGTGWRQTFMEISLECIEKCQMPESDAVWGDYLYKQGYSCHMPPHQHPYSYTVKDFCYDHPYGKYLLKTNGHVIAVIDGDYYDWFDSGDGIVLYYWKKEEN